MAKVPRLQRQERQTVRRAFLRKKGISKSSVCGRRSPNSSESLEEGGEKSGKGKGGAVTKSPPRFARVAKSGKFDLGPPGGGPPHQDHS